MSKKRGGVAVATLSTFCEIRRSRSRKAKIAAGTIYEMGSNVVIAKGKPAVEPPNIIQPYKTNIISQVQDNKNFRKVLFTGAKTQLVVMDIPKGGEIGTETHQHVEQILFFASGNGKAILNGVESDIKDGDVVSVPPGNTHNFKNTGSKPLKVYTIYSPPNHIDGRVQATKADAEKDTEDETFGSAVK